MNNQLDISLWEGSSLVRDPRPYQTLARPYYEFKVQDPYSNLAIELLLLQLCEGIDHEYTAKSTTEPPWMDNLRELLNQSDVPRTLTTLSDELGEHPVHLSRSIPKYLSLNLGGFLRQQKLKKALPYLLDKTYSLTEVAYISGFTDQSHFSKTFKSTFRWPPKSIGQAYDHHNSAYDQDRQMERESAILDDYLTVP